MSAPTTLFNVCASFGPRKDIQTLLPTLSCPGCMKLEPPKPRFQDLLEGGKGPGQVSTPVGIVVLNKSA